MFPKTRQGVVESSPTVFCQLHLAAEEVELTLIDPKHLVVSANTSTAGPGYHVFLTSWTPGFDTEYYLGRALTHMWSNVRWRSPINDQERTVLKDAADSLRNAYRLYPTLLYPWAEWNEILELLGSDVAEKDLVRQQVKAKPAIGYRRRNVTVALADGWRMQIPVRSPLSSPTRRMTNLHWTFPERFGSLLFDSRLPPCVTHSSR